MWAGKRENKSGGWEANTNWAPLVTHMVENLPTV